MPSDLDRSWAVEAKSKAIFLERVPHCQWDGNTLGELDFIAFGSEEHCPVVLFIRTWDGERCADECESLLLSEGVKY